MTVPRSYHRSDKFAALIYVATIFRCNGAIRSKELLLLCGEEEEEENENVAESQSLLQRIVNHRAR